MTVPRHHLLAALRLARLRESRPTGANSADRTHLPVQSSPSFVSISSPKPRGIIGDLRVPKLPHPIPSPQKKAKKKEYPSANPRPKASRQGRKGDHPLPSSGPHHTQHLDPCDLLQQLQNSIHTRPLQPTLLLRTAKQPGNPNPIARSPSGSVRLRLHRRGHTAHCACSAFFFIYPYSCCARSSRSFHPIFLPPSTRLVRYGTVRPHLYPCVRFTALHRPWRKFSFVKTKTGPRSFTLRGLASQPASLAI